ncbi:hypothetical protein HRS9139_02161 [Pyrenophora teres f. teres]|nr:hypothetical protein HRS9139_02161 [Pyrenophora teres f. teres]
MRSIIAESAQTSEKSFEPCHMFFYGSLMDPEVIQSVIKLTELPTTKAATISGFKIKMWGIYPALVPSEEADKVVGTVWGCKEEQYFQRLAEYETSAYTWTVCEAVLKDGTVIEGCRTFCWAGKPNSRELEEGSFDLERYQKYFKPSVTRKR